MRIQWLAGFAAGACVAVVSIVACSDDSPGDVDAAVCDCPASEPPLSGRITVMRSPGNVNPGSTGAASAFCPAGAKVLGGACALMNPDPQVQVGFSRIEQSGTAEGYSCFWSAVDATVANTGTAEAICLVPAQ
jgi:hypothetical protein